MKIKLLILILVISEIGKVHAQKVEAAFQKMALDTNSFNSWSNVDQPTISNDGKYVMYTINNNPSGNFTLVIKSIQTPWEMKVVGASGKISDDCHKAIIYFPENDSLVVLDLVTKERYPILNVSSYEISNGTLSHLLAYQEKNCKDLILLDLESGEKRKLTAVSGYFFYGNGKNLLLERYQTKDSLSIKKLDLFDIDSNSLNTIWNTTYKSEEPIVKNITYDKTQTMIAFVVEEKQNQEESQSLWYYKNGNDDAILIAGSQSLKTWLIEGINHVGFNKTGDKLFVNLKNRNAFKEPSISGGVDIWSYQDAKLQSQQLAELKDMTQRNYLAVIDIEKKKVVQLEQEDDQVVSLFGSKNFVLILNRKGDARTEWHWNKMARSAIYLVSTDNGSRTLLTDNIPESNYKENIAFSYRLSPEEKYVVYYNPWKKSYFSYEIATGKTRDITKGINTIWTTFAYRDLPMAPFMPIGTAPTCWGENDSFVLIYDQSDIFKVDPLAKFKPVNITNGFGRRNNILFRLSMGDYFQSVLHEDRIILNAFDRNNKYNGFYTKDINKIGDPVKLTMQPYIFEGTSESDNFIPVIPIKARDSNVYIIQRMSAKESPNYFITSDFKAFAPISNTYPENGFNWLRSQLIKWKTPDGESFQGILYKPENIDVKKKYPLIFYYYERLSDDLNAYLTPANSIGTLNIPYYVSNGYLVFVPDIHYEIGYPGKSTFKSIVSAANYLSKLTFVDKRKMGLQGHSRGGWETNYIITHTNIFAAAMSASGFCDFISLYGGIRTNGVTRQSGLELYFQRIGFSLWDRPDLYIENSPIFKANKVTTPLLMMNNKMDSDIPFSQGLEFFTALRRLGKKVWMLQYDGEDHIVFDNASRDLSIRMKQFFDHYLKAEPPPKWMTGGIPARMKGVEKGFELDSVVKTPGEGLSIKKSKGLGVPYCKP